MRTSTLPKSRDLSEAAERQMRLWSLSLDSLKKLEEEKASTSVQNLIHPFIAISRESGVDAGELASLLAKDLGWKLLDRGILDYMAEKYHWSRIALAYVDEKTVSWFHDTFGKWLDQQIVSQPQFVGRLGNMVLLAAQHESTVFVGRGAQFFLPRDRGLAVRIVAPKQDRIKKIMDLRQCSHRDAEKFIDETDKGRADFLLRYFHHDAADPHLYDLVINLEHTSRLAAVDLILGDYSMRFDSHRVCRAFRVEGELCSQRL